MPIPSNVRAKTDANGNIIGLISGNGNMIPTGIGHVGFVANRCLFANHQSGSNKQSMTRLRHTAMDTMTVVQMVFSNIQLLNAAEILPGGTTQITASIEYNGVLTQALFSGSPIGTISNGGVLVSDPMVLPTPIVRGASFYSRTWQNTPAGMLYNQGDRGFGNVTSALTNTGEFFQYGATYSDLTMSLTVQNNASPAFSSFGPVAIVGMTSRPTILICGDSRTRGQGEGGYPYGTGGASINAWGATGNVERWVSKRFGYCNVASSGETVAQAISASFFNVRLTFAQWASHIICEYGINDCAAGTAYTTTIANLYTFAARLGNKPIYPCTLEPESTSTDGWLTTANQTPIAVCNTQRVPYNDAIRVGLAWPFGPCIEIADNAESARNSGVWRPAFRTATDLAMTAASAVLTSTAQMAFSSGDVGKVITVAGAGAAGAPLTAIIQSYTSPTQVTLATAATTTVSAATGGIVATIDGIHPCSQTNQSLEASTAFDGLIALAV